MNKENSKLLGKLAKQPGSDKSDPLYGIQKNIKFKIKKEEII